MLTSLRVFGRKIKIWLFASQQADGIFLNLRNDLPGITDELKPAVPKRDIFDVCIPFNYYGCWAV